MNLAGWIWKDTCGNHERRALVLLSLYLNLMALAGLSLMALAGFSLIVLSEFLLMALAEFTDGQPGHHNSQQNAQT